MFAQLLKNKEFLSKTERFYKKHKKEVWDIVLFGSGVRGKEKPQDIDILLLFRHKENLDSAYELRKSLEEVYEHIQVTTKTWETLTTRNFQAREAFLSEGYSLIRKQFIAEELGYNTWILFKYDLKDISQSRRMQLQYALYGRDKKSGISHKLQLKKFADTVFLCHVEHSEELQEFFSVWKIPVESFPILLPERTA